MALYCWANYEFTKLDQAAADHPHLTDRLFAAKLALINLKEQIKGATIFSYQKLLDQIGGSRV